VWKWALGLLGFAYAMNYHLEKNPRVGDTVVVPFGKLTAAGANASQVLAGLPIEIGNQNVTITALGTPLQGLVGTTGVTVPVTFSGTDILSLSRNGKVIF